MEEKRLGELRVTEQEELPAKASLFFAVVSCFLLEPSG